jgi:hypothetical protein
MISSHKCAETPQRPITFHAAEDLGAFQLAELWADRTAWPINDRTPYDELAELACMSALATWLIRWQPIAIHSAVRAGARMEAIAAAFGDSLQVAFDCWHEWASRQRDFIINGKQGITKDQHEAVARRFAALGISSAEAK